MTEPVSINGVDVAHVRQIAAGFAADPPSGRTGFGARVRWIEGYRTETALAGDLLVDGDEPTALAGGGSAPSPEDLLLAAVGQCLTVGWVGTLSARGHVIDALEVEVSGTCDLAVAYGVGEGNPGFSGVDVHIRIESDATQALLDELAADVLAMAPIPNTVMRPLPVTHTVVAGS